jgi:CheY-like chemotaxis protein
MISEKRRAPTVLVIDDDPIMRAVISQWVLNLGCIPLAAEDGEAGLDLLNRTEVQLVVTDLIMPNVEGMEVILAVRKQLPEVPVIAISSGTSLGHADKLLQAAHKLGAAEVFEKPLKMALFVEALERLLRISPLAATSGD